MEKVINIFGKASSVIMWSGVAISSIGLGIKAILFGMGVISGCREIYFVKNE